MYSKFPPLRSLKTCVTLFTLVIFVASIWILSFFSIHMLQGDMQRVLGEQQFSTASFIAAEVNDELIDRFVALECVAKNVKIDLMHRPEAFAPIRDVQQRMSWVMTLLTLFTLLAGSLTWWMLRRQLAGYSQLQSCHTHELLRDCHSLMRHNQPIQSL